MKKSIKKQIRKAAGIYAPIFLNEGWLWANGCAGEGYIPTQYDIEETFKRYYKELKNSDNIYITSGRLAVLKTDCGYSFLLEA